MGKERGVFEAGAILSKGTAGAKALRERMWDVPCVPKAAGRGAGGGGWGETARCLCCSAAQLVAHPLGEKNLCFWFVF